MKKPFVIVLTGASSVGKKPIKMALLEDKEMELHYAKSMTTRPKKEEEIDGVDYYFIDYPKFNKAVKERKLIEFTEFGGNFYGIPREQVELLQYLGKNILIDVEAQGVGQVKLAIPEAICVFVQPESAEDLENHIRERYKDNEASMNERLIKAKVEMDLLPLFRNTVIVTDTKKAVEEIKEIIKKELEEIVN